jgi:GT2 family glycosyltransferase
MKFFHPDYCLRAKKKGFLIKSLSYIKIIHRKGKTIDSLKSSRNMFIRFKNDIIFSLRHLKIKYALFRIFIYLPLVAVFKKKRDEDEISLKTIKLRKYFFINIFLLIAAFFYDIKNIFKIKRK